MRVDVASHSNFEAAFEKCFKIFGGIDVVVNNAGVEGEINWETQLQINFFVSKCFSKIYKIKLHICRLTYREQYGVANWRLNTWARTIMAVDLALIVEELF